MRSHLSCTALGICLLATNAVAQTTINLVEVITSPPRTEHLAGMIAEFEAANPDVKVEITSLPWGQAFEKLATMVQGGQIPDVVEMPERWMSLYANNDQLVDLAPYFGRMGSRSILERQHHGFRLDCQRHALHGAIWLLHSRHVLQ